MSERQSILDKLPTGFPAWDDDSRMQVAGTVAMGAGLISRLSVEAREYRASD